MTGIEWTDETWNPTHGCDKVSPGCDNCYALTMAKRLKGMGQAGYQNDGDPRTSGPGFALTLEADRLTLPLHWRKPRKVFVDSMSDLFHADVPDEYVVRVLGVMAIAQRHTFQLLTKRHARMRSLLSNPITADAVRREVERHLDQSPEPIARQVAQLGPDFITWPLPNVWLGVSVEDQHWADIRIPALLATPAAIRWISAEPLLGPVDISDVLARGRSAGTGFDHRTTLDWVVAGGESGPGARPMHPDWARSLRDQCAEYSVPFLFKQWGNWGPGARGSDILDRPQRVTVLDAAGHQLPLNAWPPGAALMSNLGKRAAGRVLNGRTHDAYPAAAEVVA